MKAGTRERHHGEVQWLDYDTSVVIDPIVLNDWYQALETIYNVEALFIIMEQTNNGAANETIEVELTVNGTPHTFTQVAGSGAQYHLYWDNVGTPSMTGTAWTPLSLTTHQNIPLKTKSLSIRCRQTSAVDLVSAIIEINMTYNIEE